MPSSLQGFQSNFDRRLLYFITIILHENCFFLDKIQKKYRIKSCYETLQPFNLINKIPQKALTKNLFKYSLKYHFVTVIFHMFLMLVQTKIKTMAVMNEVQWLQIYP